MDRSLRRLGQLLVVMGALLGAVLGVGLALLVENAEPSRAVAAPERERVAVLTASPSSSQPPGVRAASSPNAGAANVSSGSRRVQAADQRADKANKNSQNGRDKPKGKDKPGKGKDK